MASEHHGGYKVSEQKAKLERVTITVPSELLRMVESKVNRGTYASTSEWIRHAMREQLARELPSLEELMASDPRIAESIEQARRGEGGPFTVHDFKPQQ